MEKGLEKMNNVALKALYERHLQELSNELLNGAEWKDVQDKRRLLAEISRHINDTSSGNNPAEQASRC